MKKFKIHPAFILILLLALLIGLFKDIVIILFVLLIHELGHIFFINLFKTKIIDLTLYPFGGVINYEEENDFIYKAFLINYGGVIFNIIFYIIFKLFNLRTLSCLNLYFIFINLIPIYPLDGGRGLILLLSIFIPNRLSKIIVYFISIILSIVIFIFLLMNYRGIYLLFFMLFFIKVNITSIKLINKEYQKFLLMKYLKPNNKLKTKETILFTNNPIKNMYLGKNAIFNYKTFKVKEDVVLEKHFMKTKKD